MRAGSWECCTPVSNYRRTTETPTMSGSSGSGTSSLTCCRAEREASRRAVAHARLSPWVSRKPLGLSGRVKRLRGMAMNFLACDRDQPFLMPPDPRDWLPEDHLAWFLLVSVEQMDLSAFYGSYRVDGWGRAAFEPSMMVSLLLYAYARGERSSRGIERKCVEDVAYRVIAAQQTPDHATIARFRAATRSRWPPCSLRCSRCARRRGW